jgi:2-polyprenyl-3-methyl-5-hydroxy-6-metoxy-1,4-benzoquinol methylase
MKRLADGRPYLSWCAISRNSSATLETTLRSIRARTPGAEIVIVDTLSNDFPTQEEVDASNARAAERREEGAPYLFKLDEPKSVTIAKAYADVFVEYAGPKNSWTRDMQWFDDAAAARNESFRLASGVWKGWIDADDLLPEPIVALQLLQANGVAPAGMESALTAISKLRSDATAILSLEEMLRSAELNGTECMWAPYLYRFEKQQDVKALLHQRQLPRDFDGRAMTWQLRERFVLGDKPWVWRGEAHEVLVPEHADHQYKKGRFGGLLFVHMKEWTAQDAIYSASRHRDVLLKKLERNGELSTDEFLYLENYSRFLGGNRAEFIELALDAANNGLERMRARCAEGVMLAEEGFVFEALEAFAAGTTAMPSAPEPWLAGARALKDAEQWYQAAEWFEKAIALPVESMNGTLSPREQQIEARLQAADCLWKTAGILRAQGRFTDAAVLLRNARQHALTAAQHPAAQVDQRLAACIANLCENEAKVELALSAADALATYLVANDETERAAAVVDSLPHNTPDAHPVAVKLRALAKKVRTHLTDPAAYQAFYEDQEAVGAVPSKEEDLKAGLFEPRVHFLIDQLRAWRPTATVLEAGCFDGNIGLPVLAALPEVQYIGLEAQASAIGRFVERAARWGVQDRLTLHHGLALESKGIGYVDATIFFEVIEHVADPVGTIRSLLSRLKPDGRLFLSTPWGSFDRGFPYNLERRDPRGHVRALMPEDMHEIVRKAGGRIVEQGGTSGMSGFGATMHMAIEKIEDHRAFKRAAPLVFAVPAALEDWNASSVESGGIGASEETIVYLAPKFADERPVSVYGPLPEDGSVVLEETRHGVTYWPREKAHKIDARSTVIVSRSPSTGRELDKKVGAKLDKILWLQDTTYPDLNAETAADYRRVVVLTPWHAEITEAQGVPADKIRIINNFILPEHFPFATGERPVPTRRPHHFIYASSPDRGLIPLLRMWPLIRKVLPEATLDVFYGWAGAKKLATASPAWVKRYKQVRLEHMGLIRQPGVTERGRVNHKQIAQEMMSAAAYLYPGDPREGQAFAETGCLSAIKARAAGCVMVCTPYAGLTTSAACEETQWVEMSNDELAYQAAFVDAVLRAVNVSHVARSRMAIEAAMEHVVDRVERQWREVLAR